jgi:tetratricopeptide (TPR) repeat protein
MSQQKYPKAYEAYQQAVYRDGRNPTFWCSIGVLYYQINQYRDALDAYSRAIRLNPYISEVWYDLGTLVSLLHFQPNSACGIAKWCHSTNPATIRSTMHWMPINEPPSSTPRMCTSKRVFSYCAVAKPTDFLCKPALHFLKMFTLRLTKLLGQLVLQALNGATQLPSLHPQDHHQDRPRTAGAD